MLLRTYLVSSHWVEIVTFKRQGITLTTQLFQSKISNKASSRLLLANNQYKSYSYKNNLKIQNYRFNSSISPSDPLDNVTDPQWDPKLAHHPTIQYTSEELQKMDLKVHRSTRTIHDKIAWNLVKGLRVLSDFFFKDRYLNRAVVLETVAAVPGMVAGMFRHLLSLRRMERSYGWINTLLAEAENERMHLLTWMHVVQPTPLERFFVISSQAVYFVTFSILYIVSPKTAHRFTGYLEEEAVKSYTALLESIDKGKIKNVNAPEIAIKYWNLPKTATLRDVVVSVRADEVSHRDVNHLFSDRLQAGFKH